MRKYRLQKNYIYIYIYYIQNLQLLLLSLIVFNTCGVLPLTSLNAMRNLFLSLVGKKKGPLNSVLL